MKNITTGLLSILIFFGSTQIASAQDLLQDDKIWIEAPVTNTESLKKAEISDWYDFIAGTINFGATYTRITNATLFPDSLVYQLYGNSTGGTELGKTSTHNVGQVFDPTDTFAFIENPKNINKYNPYQLDSVAFRYRYAHNIPGTVDTILIQFYNNDKVQRTVLSTSKRFTSTVAYNKATNKGVATSEMKITLDEDDVTNWSDNANFRIITVAVPNGGLDVVPGGLCAATISFIPGYAYSNGDTIEHDWNPAPTKKLNHLIVARYHDANKTMRESRDYNTALMASGASRYSSSTWNNRFIPGCSWNTYDQNYYFFFHIKAQKISVPELSADVHIYPNPSVNTPTIIEGDLEGTTLTVTDIMGRMVNVPMELTNYTELELNAGTYILIFQKDGATYTKRLIKY